MKRLIKGGKRTEEERKSGTKCADTDDFFTQDPIRPKYAFRLGRLCFDIESLRAYITENNLHEGRIVNGKNPFTRELFSAADFDKIDKKLDKVGLPRLQRRKMDVSSKIFFDKIYDLFVPYDYWDDIGSVEYNEKLEKWLENDKPDPIIFLRAYSKCDEIGERYSTRSKEILIQRISEIR